MIIRDATESDIPAVAEIYGHHVSTGLASFEEQPPSAADLLERYGAVRKGGFPYLVAVVDGQVVGSSYATLYRTRSAYRHTLEAVGFKFGRWVDSVLMQRAI